ncbi:MAG TPA: PhnD/SsuA/transferrin family substrate-binding protein [Nitrospirota bacterium]|nr:PhnD/SsuA/transferrin family substrate-binding protein [Nitrospirota bacterium]
MKKYRVFLLTVFLSFIPAVLWADQIKIAIMQDNVNEAQKYAPLAGYLKTKGIVVSFVGTPSYPAAAKMFSSGEVDAMFSGSGVAGVMILKDLAVPVVRPLGKDGFSTYWAVIVAPKGSPKFTGSADYFELRKVIFCSLASSGEFFYHTIPKNEKTNATLLKAGSHGAAIETLARGLADIAIVKNRVWDKMKDAHPELALVGEDTGENPDGTLIVSKKADPRLVSKVTAALLAVKENVSPEANDVCEKMNISGFIKTTQEDFRHTLELLKKAGVDKSFNFAY